MGSVSYPLKMRMDGAGMLDEFSRLVGSGFGATSDPAVGSWIDSSFTSRSMYSSIMRRLSAQSSEL